MVRRGIERNETKQQLFEDEKRKKISERMYPICISVVLVVSNTGTQTINNEKK